MSGDQGILEAFQSAVDETMREIETEMQTRVRVNKQDTDRLTGNMIWAQFTHTTSRPVDGVPDPQLHAHVFAFNATFDEAEQRWKAGQFRNLKRDAPYFQAAFRVRLANRLQDIGFAVERKRDDFEIAGVSTEILKRFSRRTALIEKVAKERGIQDPDQKGALGAETREKKGDALDWANLRKEWNHRLSDQERKKLASVHRRDVVPERSSGERFAVDHAIEHSFVREAVVPERRLHTEALKRGLGSVTVQSVKEEINKRPLIRSEIDGRKMATTEEMLALESRLVAFARQGRGRFRPLGDPARPCSRDWLNDGQKAAVRHVLGSRDRVMIIRGVAGTGKTTLEQEIGEALAEVKKPVVALAQSVKASREVLRQDGGFPNADTVARFLMDEAIQESARDGVILVDEASQLGTRDMLQIFDKAEQLKARVILVGDRRQHRSVAAGEPLKLLEESAGLKVAEVTEILRQQGDYKRAAKALSEGRTDEALRELDKLGWIQQMPDSERYQQLADSYLAAVQEMKRSGKPKNALVVSPTHAEAARVTDEIRDRLKSQGKLADERIVETWVPTHYTEAEKSDRTLYEPGDLLQFHQKAVGYEKGARLILQDTSIVPIELVKRFEVYRPARIALAKGDRIRITAGGKAMDGYRLVNGSLHTIGGFTRRGDIVLDNGRIISRDFGHLAHGYVVTSHGSQGSTVDKVFVAASSRSLPAVSQRMAYVAATRGREQALIFTDDRKELMAAAARADEPMSATQLADAAAKPSLGRGLALVRRLGISASMDNAIQAGLARNAAERDADHDR